MAAAAATIAVGGLDLPRILCLHGGGVTAEVFELQARGLTKQMPDFRLVFVDGPFFCDAGPGIIPVYENYGPFRRWFRWMPQHPNVGDETTIEEIRYAISTTKKNDPGTGPWVGVMGFSQGAKLTSSVLYDLQIRKEKDGEKGIEESIGGSDFKFGIVLAGRAPMVSLCEYSDSPALVQPGALTEGFFFSGDSPHVLRIPTLHFHGLQDPGLWLHRRMLKQYHDEETATVLEWDGIHRVPFKKTDIEPLVAEIYKLARKTGAIA